MKLYPLFVLVALLIAASFALHKSQQDIEALQAKVDGWQLAEEDCYEAYLSIVKEARVLRAELRLLVLHCPESMKEKYGPDYKKVTAAIKRMIALGEEMKKSLPDSVETVIFPLEGEYPWQ